MKLKKKCLDRVCKFLTHYFTEAQNIDAEMRRIWKATFFSPKIKKGQAKKEMLTVDKAADFFPHSKTASTLLISFLHVGLLLPKII